MVLSIINDFLETTKILGLDFFHADEFVHIITRFCYNLFWIFIPSYFLYFRKGGFREYFFTFIIVGTVVFQICLLLGSVSLRLGFALGLFAVFGILRYRTNQIPTREMTYLFLVIGMSVKNAVVNESISFVELVAIDILTILVAVIVEVYILRSGIKRKKVIYDRLELIHPNKYDELKQDLSKRLGVEVERVDIGPADLIRDSAELLVYFKEVKGIIFYDTPR
ncbi:DUF4956 domain-containing protein [Bacteroidota bacterium]